MAEWGCGERGEAKIDHLVKDWPRLLLIFHHQAWMTEANARGVDEACRERRVSRMELACRHATRDYLFKNPGHALVVLAHDRPVFSYRGCDQLVQLAVGRIQFGVCLFDRSVFSTSASILPRMSRQTASLISDFVAK